MSRYLFAAALVTVGSAVSADDPFDSFFESGVKEAPLPVATAFWSMPEIPASAVCYGAGGLIAIAIVAILGVKATQLL